MKDVDPRVFTKMLRKDGQKEGRTDGSVTISVPEMRAWLARKKMFGPVKNLSHWPKWHNGGPKVKSDITCFNPL